MAMANGGVAQAQAQMEDLSMANGQIVAVGEARTVLPSPNLSQVKSVDTQTKAIGLIQPPPDIRAIVDKTADFVGRNGASRPCKSHISICIMYLAYCVGASPDLKLC